MLDFIWFSCFLRSRGRKISPKEKIRCHLYLVLPLLQLPYTTVNSVYLGRVRYIKLFLVLLDSFLVWQYRYFYFWCRRQPILNKINEAMILLLFVRFLPCTVLLQSKDFLPNHNYI